MVLLACVPSAAPVVVVAFTVRVVPSGVTLIALLLIVLPRLVILR
jgi:hypothetical protein